MNQIQVSTLDHSQRKESLIEYLRTKSTFADFDYEGSTINTLIDLLVYDDTYTAVLANMVANESFSDTARVRSNVVSHATKKSYTPRSATASKLICDIVVTPAITTGLVSSITMPAGSSFLTSIDGKTYTFVTHEDNKLGLQTNNTYLVSSVQLHQGQRITNRFTHTAETAVTIQNQRADTSTLIVNVYESEAVDTFATFTKASSIIELTSASNVYFLSEDSDGNATIEFGRNIIGVEPATGSIIEVIYINTEKDHANGASSLIAATPISGYSNIAVSVTTVATGGSERESIESVRFLSTKAYQAQERAVSELDYVALLKQNFPFVQSAISWGGEKNDPPLYGNVVISVISNQTDTISASTKSQMIALLDDYNVGSITPIIVDAERIGLDLSIRFSFDQRRTNKTYNQLATDVSAIASAYKATEVGDYTQFYNNSELIDRLMDINGIVSVSLDKTAFKDITVLRFNSPVYTVKFKNKLQPSTLAMQDFAVSSSGSSHRLYDSAGIVYLEYKTAELTTVTQSIGTVNYTTGVVEFTLNMIQDASTVRLYTKTVEDNFTVDTNTIVFINAIETSLLT